jgi:anaerobic selenocysteine-containing dehydrogenase
MRFGIKEGDWLFVETKKGGIKARATYAENLDERVVIVEHGWWFPEMKESYLDFNINVLTSWETIFPVTGSPLLRGVPCRLKVVREENG